MGDVSVAISDLKMVVLGLVLASPWGCASPNLATTHRLPNSLLAEKGPIAPPAVNHAVGRGEGQSGVRKASLSDEDVAGAPELPNPGIDGSGNDRYSRGSPAERVETLLRSEPGYEPTSMPGARGPSRQTPSLAADSIAATPLQRMEGRIQEMTLELEAIDPLLAEEFLVATRKAAEGGNLETVLVAWRATIEHRQRRAPTNRERENRLVAKPATTTTIFEGDGATREESVLTPIPEGMPRRAGTLTISDGERDIPTRQIPLERGSRITTVEPEPRPSNTIATRSVSEGDGESDPVRLTYRSPDAAANRDSPDKPRTLAMPLAGSREDLESRMITLAQELDRSESAGSTESLRAQVHSRLLYLMAGDSRQGLKPIFGSDGIDRKYWQGYLWSLQQYFDAKSIPRSEGRAAESILSLQEAIAALRQRADLEITTPVLCSNVAGYGIYDEFANYTFRASQTVVVYWELRNFSSIETKDGFRTRTAWAFEIIDARGDRRYRFGRDFGDDLCRNQRQDYFNVVKFTMPADITPGEYTLKVISTDKTTEKVAEKQIRFVIQ